MKSNEVRFKDCLTEYMQIVSLMNNLFKNSFYFFSIGFIELFKL